MDDTVKSSAKSACIGPRTTGSDRTALSRPSGL